jgi:hypothetical protein
VHPPSPFRPEEPPTAAGPLLDLLGARRAAHGLSDAERSGAAPSPRGTRAEGDPGVVSGEGWMLGGAMFYGWNVGFFTVKPKKNQGNGKLLPCFYHEKMVVD